MANPYDTTWRERVVRAYETSDQIVADVAAVFGISSRTLERWLAQQRAVGTLVPQTRGGGWTSPVDAIVLNAVVAAQPDRTTRELCRAYNGRVPRSRRSSRAGIGRALARLGFVRKKNGRAPRSKTGPTSSAADAPSGGGSGRSMRGGWCLSMSPGRK